MPPKAAKTGDGEVVERLKAPASKAGVPDEGTVSSNLTLSAIYSKSRAECPAFAFSSALTTERSVVMFKRSEVQTWPNSRRSLYWNSSRVRQGADARSALNNARDVAAHAEALGYKRIWIAEHHNMAGIASAATSIVIAHIAAGTSTIRVGAGGIMLPNHSPYIIAEQFGTLERLFPGRIDLGLGRAPGTDQIAMRAMRRGPDASDSFPQDVLELQAYLAEPEAGQAIVAVPAAGTNVPLWILGSSTFGAMLAAELGLPYAFASHFAPDLLLPALQTYRSRFKPSAQLERPYAMAGINVIAADTDAEAKRLATTQQMSIADLVTGKRGLSKPPIDDIETYWSSDQKARALGMLSRSVVGSPQTVRAGLRAFVDETKVDELMVVSDVFDHQARLRSLELIAAAAKA